jgi:hypothetical protein
VLFRSIREILEVKDGNDIDLINEAKKKGVI